MEKLLYHEIYSAVYSHSSDLKLNQSSTPCEIRNAIRWIMRNNPDIFWFAHQYQFDEASSTIHLQYTFSAERVKTIQQSINDVIENDFCIEYVKKLSQQEQVAYVYKWLVTYCTYNANSAYNQSIYSVFVRRNSVCTGYAKAAQYLFNLLGIESCLVFGLLHNDKEDGRHCWNLVKVDNEYYHFDACFGDSILDNVAIKSGVQELFNIDSINYNFLCVSTDEILKTRNIEDITTLPDCPNSWHKTLVKSLAQTKLQHREGIRGCLLSHIGSSADIYLCSKDKNTVLKVFRPNSKTTSQEEYHYMQQTKGCRHLLQCNEDYTDIAQNTVAIEQSTPIVDLLCSHYYELSLKGLIKMAIDVAKAWKECQERGVLYRDIHVCNIYRSNDGVFKLGDFGSCTNKFDLKETVGNQWFMAPETFVSGIFTESSAVYSISMVMYFILNNLRPAFWTQGCEDEALQKRMNGYNLPIPAGCINLPPHIKTKLDQFFTKVSASLPKERISSIAEFIYKLERLSLYCEDSDYIIHRKGFSLDFDLNAGNEDRLNARGNYIPRDAYHQYAMGDEVERMCTTAMVLPNSVCHYDIAPDDGAISVDVVEEFARTRGGCNCEFNEVDSDGSFDGDWHSDFRVDEAAVTVVDIGGCSTDLVYFQENKPQMTLESIHKDEFLHPILPHDSKMVGSDNSCNIDGDFGDAFEVLNTIRESDNFSYSNESFVPLSSLSDNTRLKKFKNECEKTITCLSRQQEQLKSVQSQIDELKKKKNEIKIQLKNSPGMIVSAVGGFWSSIIGGLTGIVGALAGSTSTSSDEAKEKLLECDKELEAKMAQAQICEKQIEGLVQKKNNLEKELALLEETNKYNEVYSSIFAPAEFSRDDYMMIQVYLYRDEEQEKVATKAKLVDPDSVRKNFTPLDVLVKKGDRVNVHLQMAGKGLEPDKTDIEMIYQDRYTDCQFCVYVPENYKPHSVVGIVTLSVNGVPAGRMMFKTKIVDAPRSLYAEIMCHKFNKIFISYSHYDEDKVKFIHQAYEALNVEHFFDRAYLRPGDVYPEKIRNYIASADLFILCWSENAKNSEYVQLEILDAMKRAYPGVEMDKATLAIHPLDIEPHAELPEKMNKVYHFGRM